MTAKAKQQRTERSSIECNLCGSDIVNEIGNTDRNGGYLRSVICTKCGLSWSDPRPNEDEIRNFYSKDYRIEYKGTHKPKLKHVYRAGKIALSRREFIKDILTDGDILLDIGAGGGEFVYLMNKFGYETHGIEPNVGYGSYAQQELEVPIQIGFVQQVGLQENFYDVVAMHHVLEHLDDPYSALKKIHKSLHEDGFLVVEVPNIESTCAVPSGRFHAAHLYNFNPESLEQMGGNAGFSIYKTQISADGGVITTIFQKSEKKEPGSSEIPGNFDRISAIIKKHSALTHYLTPNPYLRPTRKLLKYFGEKRWTSDCTSGKEVLEKLFRSAP